MTISHDFNDPGFGCVGYQNFVIQKHDNALSINWHDLCRTNLKNNIMTMQYIWCRFYYDVLCCWKFHKENVMLSNLEHVHVQFWIFQDELKISFKELLIYMPYASCILNDDVEYFSRCLSNELNFTIWSCRWCWTKI